MKILYIGGFELPDKNAAAQRVVGIAKALRFLGNEVIFINALKFEGESSLTKRKYFDFKCLEYKRESEFDYLVTANTAIRIISLVNPDAVIAYNYPAMALNKIRKYCQKREKKCFADVTEWYEGYGNNIIYRLIKNADTAYRMRYVNKRMDGIIAISRYLYDYYKQSTNTVLIPPTIDLSDRKWKIKKKEKEKKISFVYAGVPCSIKERLDLIVRMFAKIEKKHNVCLKIIGITQDEFVQMYSWVDDIPKSIIFYGKMDHKKVLEIVKQANWSIIIRDNNRVVKAGFPTKLVESISCGVPVICNEFSNITDYLDDSNSIIINSFLELRKVFIIAESKLLEINNSIFDYHLFIDKLSLLGF